MAASLTVTLEAAESTPLFNGKDLTSWKVPDPNPFWTVVDGVLVGHASAVLAASIFHFGTYTIGEAKRHMRNAGIAVRMIDEAG